MTRASCLVPRAFSSGTGGRKASICVRNHAFARSCDDSEVLARGAERCCARRSGCVGLTNATRRRTSFPHLSYRAFSRFHCVTWAHVDKSNDIDSLEDPVRSSVPISILPSILPSLLPSLPHTLFACCRTHTFQSLQAHICLNATISNEADEVAPSVACGHILVCRCPFWSQVLCSQGRAANRCRGQRSTRASISRFTARCSKCLTGRTRSRTRT